MPVTHSSTQTDQSTQTYGEALGQLIEYENAFDLLFSKLLQKISQESSQSYGKAINFMRGLATRYSNAKQSYSAATRQILTATPKQTIHDYPEKYAEQYMSPTDYMIFNAYVCTIRTMKVAVEDILNLVTKYTSNLLMFQTIAEAYNKKQAALKEKITTAEKALNLITTDNTEAIQKATALLQNQIKNLKKHNTNLGKKITKLEDQLGVASEKTKALEASNKAKDSQIAELTTQLAAERQRIEELETHKKRSTTSMSDLLRRQAPKDLHIHQLRQQLEQTMRQVAQLTARLGQQPYYRSRHLVYCTPQPQQTSMPYTGQQQGYLAQQTRQY
jgi:hypothetical protein